MTDAARRFRALFISDVHLGTRGCQAERLLDFLRHHDAETIYLVGDIVDGWRAALELVLAAAAQRRGAEAAAQGAARARASSTCRATTTSSCATITARISAASRWCETAIHEAADGRRYLVIHGDLFDVVVHAGALARAARRQGLRRSRSSSIACFNAHAPPLRLALLVAVAMGEAQGQERGQFHRRRSSRRSPGGAAAARRRRDLRPHPPRRRSHDDSACTTSIAATGWKAARRRLNARTVLSKSSTGHSAKAQ